MSEKGEYKETEWTDIASRLQRSLGPEYLQQRPGPSGHPLTYIEGKTAINIANDIFGFNGWSTDIKDTTIDFLDQDEGRWSAGVSVTVRVTLKDGSYHEDVGYGHDQNNKSKGQALEKSRKQAVTDATKRTLRFFGNALGNCLYDKPYLSGIGKMAKPTIKFTAQNLYRHTQFDGPKPEPPQPTQLQYHQPESSISSRKPQPQQGPPQQRYQPPPLQQQVQAPVPKSLPRSTVASVTTTPIQETHETYVSPYLIEPIIPEDSFSYEGDEEFLVQMLAADEGAFKQESDIDEEMLAGIITPPPRFSSSPAPGSTREAPLSDSDESISSKRTKRV